MKNNKSRDEVRENSKGKVICIMVRAGGIVCGPPPQITHLRPPPSSVPKETPFCKNQNGKTNKNNSIPTSSTTKLNSLLHSTTELNFAQRHRNKSRKRENAGDSAV